MHATLSRLAHDHFRAAAVVVLGLYALVIAAAIAGAAREFAAL